MSVQHSPIQSITPLARSLDSVPKDVLLRLLAEYTLRLNEFMRLYSLRTERNVTHRAEEWIVRWVKAVELRQDIDYLREQLGNLVEKASAYHEHMLKDEGERYEFELRLFDAETALRYSEATIKGIESR